LNKLLPVASGFDGRSGKALYIHQNAEILLGHLDSKNKIHHVLKGDDHGAYIQVIKGNLDVNGNNLKTGDAIEVKNERKLNLSATMGEVEYLTLDVPMSNYLDPRAKQQW
jgi:redox-sensitive bicupin YhaK (pirin superfamily)